MKYIKLLFITLFILINISLFSQEDKIVVSLLVDSENDEALKEVITESISIELEVADFDVNRENESFTIKCLYSTDRDILNIVIDCYSIVTSEKILSVSNTGRINLDLDLTIQSLARDLISRLKEVIKKNPELIADPVMDEEIIEEITEAEIDDFKKITITVSVSSFLTTGDASNYFKNGIMPELSLTYRIKQDFGYISAGIRSSANMFKAKGLVYSSDNMLISAGPVIGIGFNTNSAIEISAFLSSGLTMFMIDSEVNGADTTYIPYVSSGLGFNLNFTNNLALYLKTGYDIYFEESVLLTGFSPSVGLTINI